MDFTQGRPRFWIPGFDTAHLALPALTALVAVLIVVLPTPPVPKPPVVRVPIPPKPAPATVILQPVSGTVLGAGQMKSIEGLAPPGASVQLYWVDRPLGSPALVGADGRWTFSTAGFPPGRHAFRVVSRTFTGTATSAPVVVAIQSPPVPTGKSARRR
ncbi:MAG: hypothetical protein U1G08_17145 [Verrucomicrobiota bacterium]